LKFADDTKVFQELRDEADCSMLQSDLDKLVTWAEKVMYVGKQKNSCCYYMGGMKLIEEIEKRFRSLHLSRHEVFSAMHVCI